MLWLDDDDVLPASPDEQENTLALQLGVDGLESVDEAIMRHARDRWLKVARVVLDALKVGGFSAADETHVRLHVRRVIGLVDVGRLEAQGNLRRPRFSEVRLPDSDGAAQQADAD
jgi:hypothetical protein